MYSHQPVKRRRDTTQARETRGLDEFARQQPAVPDDIKSLIAASSKKRHVYLGDGHDMADCRIAPPQNRRMEPTETRQIRGVGGRDDDHAHGRPASPTRIISAPPLLSTCSWTLACPHDDRGIGDRVDSSSWATDGAEELSSRSARRNLTRRCPCVQPAAKYPEQTRQISGGAHDNWICQEGFFRGSGEQFVDEQVICLALGEIFEAAVPSFRDPVSPGAPQGGSEGGDTRSGTVISPNWG